MKENLVIIPAGPDALFQDWPDYTTFNFDLALVLWTPCNLKNAENAKFYDIIPDHKWKLIFHFASKYDLSNYEYIFVLDDDILTSPEVIDLIFRFCKEYNLDLAQPAMSLDSYHAGSSSTLIPGAKMHITNSVEIMCPIFSKRAWPICISHADKMPIGVGFGLEGFWTKELESQGGITKFGGLVAVIDQYPVKHTRPTANAETYKQRGYDPREDWVYFENLGYPLYLETIKVIYR